MRKTLPCFVVIIATLSTALYAAPPPHADSLDDSKVKCAELGFEPGTEKFGECVLKLSAFIEQTPIEENTPPTEKIPEAKIKAVTTTQAVSKDPVQLQTEYQQAFNLLRGSLYDQAIPAFQQFLTLYPNDIYSDHAQYWLAETFYVKRDFEVALVEYNKVVNNFPQSQKVNDALLKIGFTLFELGDMAAAKMQFQGLIDKLPGSWIARLADERLKMINSTNLNTPPVSN